MLSRFSHAGALSCTAPHKLRLSFKDKCRTETDVAHRFIAQLKSNKLKIEKVDIRDRPVCADIVLVKVLGDEIADSAIANLFSRWWTKGRHRLKVHLTVIGLDDLGLNFHINYKFEDQPREELCPLDMRIDEHIHRMMETAFEGNSNFLLSRMTIIGPK